MENMKDCMKQVSLYIYNQGRIEQLSNMPEDYPLTYRSRKDEYDAELKNKKEFNSKFRSECKFLAKILCLI